MTAEDRALSNYKTAEEWCAAKGLRILDPDGWRMAGAPDWEQPISEDEFDERAAISTTGPARCCVRNLRTAACDYPACWEA